VQLQGMRLVALHLLCIFDVSLDRPKLRPQEMEIGLRAGAVQLPERGEASASHSLRRFVHHRLTRPASAFRLASKVVPGCSARERSTLFRGRWYASSRVRECARPASSLRGCGLGGTAGWWKFRSLIVRSTIAINTCNTINGGTCVDWPAFKVALATPPTLRHRAQGPVACADRMAQVSATRPQPWTLTLASTSSVATLHIITIITSTPYTTSLHTPHSTLHTLHHHHQ
jgi:hypothetical protein